MNRTEFKEKVRLLFGNEGMRVIMMAYDLAKYGHRGQSRESVSSDAPEHEKRYFNHPRSMASALIDAGIRDVGTICVALLHDTGEDCAILCNQKIDGYYVAMEELQFRLARMFDSRIAGDVIALTLPLVNPEVPEFATKNQCLLFYKQKILNATSRALLVKTFDRLDNLSTIEVKKPAIAALKLKETEEFYLPRFFEVFSRRTNAIDALGCRKTFELKELVTQKKGQLGIAV